jgi:hypothetical protein
MTRSRGRSASDLSSTKEQQIEIPTRSQGSPKKSQALQDVETLSSEKKDALSDPESDRDEPDREEHTPRPTEPRKVDNNGGTNLTNAKKEGKPKEERNELTKLIPGYTAPLKLNTSLLDKYRPSGGIRALQQRAERTDKSTKDFVVEATKNHTSAMQKKPGSLPSSYTQAYSSFKKGSKRAIDNTAGSGWFNMNPTPMTEELKADLAVVKNRSYLDPKKFYKSSDKAHGIVQLGTVIEGASEYYSSRLTKKQRRTNITEEVMADKTLADYTVNKFKDMAREKTAQAKKRKNKPKRAGRKFY